MSRAVSAGLLMYRHGAGGIEVFLAHPGGPYFALKDQGHWTVPKGEAKDDETLLEVAQREFEEETGLKSHGPFSELGSIQQKCGKIVHAWAFRGDVPKGYVCRSNTHRMEFPAGSGRFIEIPEVDRAEFFPLAVARLKIKPTQVPFLDRLETLVGAEG